MVAIDAHGMAAIGQNHFGTRLQADPTFIFPLQICIRDLPHRHLQVVTPPLVSRVLRQITMETLK